MRKAIVISIFATFVLLFLQFLWIGNAYHNYTLRMVKTLEDITSDGIQKELSTRSYSPPKDPNKPKFIYKKASEMTPEERESLKGDTLDMVSLKKNNIGMNMTDLITQLEQDNFIADGNFLNLEKLDSIFQVLLSEAELNTRYRIYFYNRDTLEMDNRGNLPKTKSKVYETRLFPIGLKATQFIQVKTDLPFSTFLREMTEILGSSILMVLIVAGCVVWLFITIKHKDKLFKQREASVNGTVHDLKAPLNSIILLMGLLKQKLPDEDSKSLTEVTLKQSKNMVNDIEALLLTARHDRQQVMLKKELTDLVALTQQATESISPQYTAKTHQLDIEAEAPQLMVNGDRMYLTNVIRNLIENALKYSDDGVKVCIRIRQEGQMAVVEVEDNGWGIPQKYQKKIFNQFFQVPRGEGRHQRGYGVGLAFSKYVMEAHGGVINVRSEEGEGSTFTCIFPIN